MARKEQIGKNPNAKLISEQIVAIAEFARKILGAADQVRGKSKFVEGLSLPERERLVLSLLPAISTKGKKKLMKADADFTVAEIWEITLAVADSFVDAEPKQQIAMLGITKKLMDCLQENIVMPDESVKAKKPKSDLLFQFKITLHDIKPAIWRRIQVSDCTLAELHGYIQAAFGWEDCHLHVFKIDGVEYSQPPPDGDDFDLDYEDETDILLSKLLPKSAKKKRWLYEYDFGDDWQHEVLFEGYPPSDPKAKYPLCLEGERACPPEDCGGPWGYADYIAAIADTHHEQHEEMLEWRGPFDSEKFDPKKATREMRKVK